jgi:hypothetical protein
MIDFEFARSLSKKATNGLRVHFSNGREITNTMQFEQGIEAAWSNKLVEDNPYPSDSVSGSRWLTGYAFYSLIEDINCV